MNKDQIEIVKATIEEVKQEARNGWGIAPYDWGVIDDILSKVVQNLEKMQEATEPLTETQKKYISLFKGKEYAQCTDGCLMTELGMFDWKEAEKLIAQYEREGKHE